MEEIGGGVGRGLWAAIRYILWNFLFAIVLFNIGRLALLVGTLGRFPPSHHLPRYEPHVACVGLAVIVLAWLALVTFNRMSGGA